MGKRRHAADATYRQTLIATTFSTVAAAIWPVTGRGCGHSAELVEVTGLSTLDVITRLRASAVDQPTLDALRITADQLCTDYPHLPAEQLLIEGRAWLHRISSLLGAQMTLTQHREILVAAGWLALLVGCVEHDLGDRRAAEGTRQAALSLGMEAQHPEIQGWACEMLAWFDLTRGDYPGVIAASDEGIALAGDSSVSVQLFAQKAKGWARLGDRRMAWVALEEGRRLLWNGSRAGQLEHHFVVDPAKFDFYGMDVYSVLGENALAATYAGEVIHASTASDGTPRAPMRIAEALTTQGLVAAREGEIELAVSFGREALAGEGNRCRRCSWCPEASRHSSMTVIPANPRCGDTWTRYGRSRRAEVRRPARARPDHPCTASDGGPGLAGHHQHVVVKHRRS